MTQTHAERARLLAQTLVEVLTAYEEELLALEREAPAMGQLRRAVGIAIAEGCYIISDNGEGLADWVPPADGQTRRAG